MTDATIISTMKKYGLRDTQPRRAVVHALQTMKAPASAYQIRDWLSAQKIAIKPTSIYRILISLEQAQVIHKHPCNGYYALCSIPEQSGHHGFLHCSGCHKVEEFVNEELCKVENTIARTAKFKPATHVSEITGLCHPCQQ